MRIDTFRLERYFSEREFAVEHNLAASDCEPLSQAELLDMAGDDEMELWEELRLGYTQTRGAPFLREQVARLYQCIEPEQVLVCAPVEGIFLAMNSILEAGDHVICCYPHNPTGNLPVLSDLERIVEIARKRDAYLFSDEMYMYLEQDPGARLPAACGVYERAVCLFGMSKTFGMAGARIGWLATRDSALYARMAGLKDYTTICSSAPSEVLSTIALKSADRIAAANLARIRENLDLLDEFFDRQQEVFYWSRPSAGSVAFPRLLSNRSADEFCAAMIEAAGVLLLPASVFDYGQSHFRVGFGRAGLEEAVAALEEHLTEADL